jgi:hypothetical protein
MKCTEDQFRSILREEAADITAESVPPLSRPDRDLIGLSRGPASSGSPRGRRWLVPLGAAAAVTAIVAAATAIATGTHGHLGGAPSAESHVIGGPPYYVLIQVTFGKPGKERTIPIATTTSPTGTSTSPTVTFTGPIGNTTSAIPPTIRIRNTISQITTTIRDTMTGAVLATVHPPRGYSFANAAPGANDDSFLLLADNQHGDPAAIYLLRFNPAARSTTLTRLAIPVTRDTQEFAMSPTGTEVAVVSGTDGPQTAKTSWRLQVYALSGRMIRQWRGPGVICADAAGNSMPCLSWAASGYLAFLWTNNGTNGAADGIRLIRAAAPSGSLLRASRLVVRINVLDVGNLLLSGNGATIIAAVTLGHFSAFEEFSTATGELTGRYWVTSGLYGGAVYWSSRTGSTLMVAAPYPRTSGNPQFPLGVLTRGRFTPLPSQPEPSTLSF